MFKDGATVKGTTGSNRLLTGVVSFSEVKTSYNRSLYTPVRWSNGILDVIPNHYLQIV